MGLVQNWSFNLGYRMLDAAYNALFIILGLWNAPTEYVRTMKVAFSSSVTYFQNTNNMLNWFNVARKDGDNLIAGHISYWVHHQSSIQFLRLCFPLSLTSWFQSVWKVKISTIASSCLFSVQQFFAPSPNASMFSKRDPNDLWTRL